MERGGITNNLDGGLSFQPDSYFAGNGNEYMTGIIQPHELKLYIAGEEFKIQSRNTRKRKLPCKNWLTH